MKLIVMTIAILFTSTTYASIPVGTVVEYSHVTVESGVLGTVTLGYKVLNYLTADDKYLVSMSYDDGAGTTHAEDIYFDGPSITAGAYMLSNCVADGGTIETIAVAAGEFETCYTKVVYEDGEIYEQWIGDVPFNLVKDVQTLVGGDSFATELKLLK